MRNTRLLFLQFLAIVSGLAGCASNTDGIVGPPPLQRPPAPHVFITMTSPWLREAAVGDTMKLAATYFDSTGRAVPGRPVQWSFERPTAHYTIDDEGVVVPIRAGGTSFTNVKAVIDGVVGYFPMNYRVLGWQLEVAYDERVAMFEWRAVLASRFPDASPPPARRTGLHTDYDGVIAISCSLDGHIAMRMSLPNASAGGDITFTVNDSSFVERWNVVGDGYELHRFGDATELLTRLVSVREFSVSYTTVGGTRIASRFPGYDPEGATRQVVGGCR